MSKNRVYTETFYSAGEQQVSQKDPRNEPDLYVEVTVWSHGVTTPFGHMDPQQAVLCVTRQSEMASELLCLHSTQRLSYQTTRLANAQLHCCH